MTDTVTKLRRFQDIEKVVTSTQQFGDPTSVFFF